MQSDGSGRPSAGYRYVFLTAGEPDVHRTRQKILRHIQQLNFIFDKISEIKAVQRLFTTIFAHCIDCGLQEELVTYPGISTGY